LVQRFSKFLQHPVARVRTVPSNQIAEGFKFCSLYWLTQLMLLQPEVERTWKSAVVLTITIVPCSILWCNQTSHYHDQVQNPISWPQGLHMASSCVSMAESSASASNSIAFLQLEGSISGLDWNPKICQRYAIKR